MLSSLLKNRLLFPIFGLFILIFLTFTGCGGGGGGGDSDSEAVSDVSSTAISYSGYTNKAVITEENAEDLTMDSYSGGRTAVSTASSFREDSTEHFEPGEIFLPYKLPLALKESIIKTPCVTKVVTSY